VVSRRAVAAVIQASRDPDRFNHAEFRVMVNLADHLNDRTGQCNPGLQRLEEETGLGRGHLMRTINQLEDRGELFRPGPSKGGRGHKQQYVILLKGTWEGPF
jgi:DNA-binding MarR family transcriptional regulator